MYDLVIIGGGPSGLYTAQQIHRVMKNKKILILEKNGYLGGRTRMEMFCGKSVVTGAGVGRTQKDVLLKESTHFTKKSSWESSVCLFPSTKKRSSFFMIKILKILKREFLKNPSVRSTMTFKEFFLKHFCREEYERFCWYNGYTDFENADIKDTLWDYGFEDNFSGSSFFRVDWNKWMQDLHRSLDSKTVHTVLNSRVREWVHQKHYFVIKTTDGHEYRGKNVVIAGTMSVVKNQHIKKAIGYNAFLRMYAYNPHSVSNNKDCSVWYRQDEFQKTIPLSDNVVMLSYSDNDHAIRTNHMTFKEIREKNPTITKLQKFFWRHGTHYYRPLDTQKWRSREEFLEYAQNPLPHLFIVGEMVSNNQGWTEGALESVQSILSKLMKQLQE